MKNYKSAGVLLLELYKENNVITLFGKNNKFSDLSGYIDEGESPIQAAYREAREESANLIYIEPKYIKKMGYVVNGTNHKTFIIYVKGLRQKHYYNNINRVKHCNSKSWKETNEMTRIPLYNFYNDKIYDINNRLVKIRESTLKTIKNNLKLLQNVVLKTKPYKLINYICKQSRMSCLIGTNTYRPYKSHNTRFLQVQYNIKS